MLSTDAPAGGAGGASNAPDHEQSAAASAQADMPELPAKMRVHALAKQLGLTSRQVLSTLADLGEQARSPQSNLTREVALRVVQTLRPSGENGDQAGDSEVSAEGGSGSGSAASASTSPGRSGSAEVTSPETAAQAEAAPQAAAAEASAPETAAETTSETGAAAQASSGREVAAAGTAAGAESTSGSGGASAGESVEQSTSVSGAPAAQDDGATEAHSSAAAPSVAAPPAAMFLPPQASQARGPATEETSAGQADRGTESAGAEATAEREETDAETHEPEGDGSDTDDSSARRRRRRGRRGRGRGRGGEGESAGAEESKSDQSKPGQDDSQGSADESGAEQHTAEAESADSESDADGGDSGSDGGGGRRRRRRRRRKSGNDGDSASRGDDPPDTVVHVRESRPQDKDTKSDSGADEVRSVKGSTRLEAKRQRRRDGRDAGRRRAPVLSESEFLARRESVDRTMVVRDHGDRTQVAVLEDDILVEHFVTSSGSGSVVGNVYLGRVQNVLPSMEAAFVDIGRGRNAVLYAGEVDWDAAGLEGKSRRIEQALSSGDSVLVQVTKDPVGHKGARLTTQISLPGRFLVYVPGGGATGISRKLPDNERKRLKDLLKRIVPEDSGVIIRTASEGVSEEALDRDVRRLQAQWEVIKEKSDASNTKAPELLYEEPDLLIKVVRDLFTEDFSSMTVQGSNAWDTIEPYVQHVAPDLVSRLHKHTGQNDVFAEKRINEQISKALDRKVWLPSGGYLVIDRTEAMTVIDVNTGKFTGSGGNLEETVTRNNLEAAEEVVRQLRLRDIGGIIVIDFIDMVLESNRDLVLRRLTECLGRDRTRHQVAEVTSLGLVQMTRKRVGTGLLEAYSTTCEQCRGRGLVVSTEPVAHGNGHNHGGGSSSGGQGGNGQSGGSRRHRQRGKSGQDHGGESGKRESGKSESSKSDSGKQGSGKSDSGKHSAGKHGPGKHGSGKPDSAQSGSGKQGSGKSEPVKQESGHAQASEQGGPQSGPQDGAARSEQPAAAAAAQSTGQSTGSSNESGTSEGGGVTTGAASGNGAPTPETVPAAESSAPTPTGASTRRRRRRAASRPAGPPEQD